MTAANLITVLRMVLIPFFLLAVTYGTPWLALTLFLVAGISDGLDGFIARFYFQKTAFGAVLDPMADKLIMTTAYVALAIPSSAFPYTIPVWLAVLVISRDVVIVLISIVLNMTLDIKKFTPTMLGKTTTCFQIIYVLAVLVQNVHEIHPLFTAVFTWIVAALTVASGVHYLMRVPRQTQEIS